MGNQDELTVETAGNVGRFNNMMIIGGTSDYLNNSITKRHGMVVISYDTANNMVQWHLYVWDDNAKTYVDVSMPDHTHSSVAGDGGEYYLVRVAHERTIIFDDMAPQKAHWLGQVFSGTGAAIADDNTVPIIKLSTGTTTTGYATIFQGTIPLDFAFKARWSGAWTLSAITNILLRWGLGVEDPNASTNNNEKIGIEWCDSQAQPNYYTLSANGSSRSLVDSTIPLSTGVDGFRIVFYPASKAEYKFEDGTIFNKSSVLPTVAIAASNTVRWGVKNNNGGAVNRDLSIRGTFVAGKATLTQWVS